MLYSLPSQKNEGKFAFINRKGVIIGKTCRSMNSSIKTND